MLSLPVQRSFYNATQDAGYWSPSSSTANFCEEDYIISHYIGEFINTISNLAYVFYAINPPNIRISHLKTSSDLSAKESRLFENGSRSQVKFDAPSIALILVGITSAAFHATLHAIPQWFDETSMYLLAALWIHILLTTTYVKEPSNRIDGDSKGRPPKRERLVIRENRYLVAGTLIAALLSASFSSFWTGHLAIHSIVFALLLVVSGIKLIRLITLTTAPPRRLDSATESISILSNWRRSLFGSLLRCAFFLVLAFGLWVADSTPEVCAMLRHLRNDILGPIWYLRPLAFLTELHGWWHILTARAAGEYIVLVRILTTDSDI